MGVLYEVWPLNDETYADAERESWLLEYQITRPPLGEQGRWPSAVELKQCINAIEGHIASFHIGADFFDVTVRPLNLERSEEDYWQYAYSPLIALDFHGDEGKPLKFYFEKGWPELHALVMKNLACCCGPYILFGDVDVPLLITGTTTLDSALQAWNVACRRRCEELENIAAEESEDA